jgi:hypothetical protein
LFALDMRNLATYLDPCSTLRMICVRLELSGRSHRDGGAFVPLSLCYLCWFQAIHYTSVDDSLIVRNELAGLKE